VINAAELAQNLLDGCCQLVDVREPVEYAEERIKGAKLVPLGELERRCGELDKSKPVVVMCRAGTRGQQALNKLRALGFEQVSNLDGGILAWAAAGKPMERSERRGLPLMRQVQLIIGLCVLTGSILALTVNPLFAAIPAFFGAGLTLAGSTGWCGLALLLAKMPWNNRACAKGESCCG
jgi:rhodanese-related sulfurtransferase